MIIQPFFFHYHFPPLLAYSQKERFNQIQWYFLKKAGEKKSWNNKKFALFIQARTNVILSISEWQRNFCSSLSKKFAGYAWKIIIKWNQRIRSCWLDKIWKFCITASWRLFLSIQSISLSTWYGFWLNRNPPFSTGSQFLSQPERQSSSDVFIFIHRTRILPKLPFCLWKM